VSDPKKPEITDGLNDTIEKAGSPDAEIIQQTRDTIGNSAVNLSSTEFPELTPEEQALLLTTIVNRLNQKPAHYSRPNGISITEVKKALEANPHAMWSLAQMEKAGGEPDIIEIEKDYFIFADCSKESPAGHLNCVYDREIQESLTGEKAKNCIGNAVDMARDIGVDLMDELTYAAFFQRLGTFDQHTYNLLLTQADDRKTGRIIVGDRSGSNIRIYHFPTDVSGPDVRGGWRGIKRVRKAV